MAKKIERIGLLTAGGDCPGLNAVIMAVTKTAINKHKIQVVGFKDGYDGLIRDNSIVLESRDVSGILPLGGTILGTSNIANPYKYAVTKDGKTVFENRLCDVMATYRRHSLDALITVGGDGTLSVALKLCKDGLNIVGVPKTIDNDLSETTFTFGFDTAVSTATEAIDKLHSTAQSHHRVMILEVMGRYAGWIALYAGIAGGGDVILIPEIPFDMKKVCAKLEERKRHGKRFSIIVVAEGAKPKGGSMTVARVVEKSHDKVRLGGVSNKICDEIEKMTGLETRATILGHVQRGGSPTAFDRNLGTLFGEKAMELVMKRKFGRMVALKLSGVGDVPLAKAVGKLKLVPMNLPLLKAARAIGTSFGD